MDRDLFWVLFVTKCEFLNRNIKQKKLDTRPKAAYLRPGIQLDATEDSVLQYSEGEGVAYQIAGATT